MTEKWKAVEATLLRYERTRFEYGPADCGAFLMAYFESLGWEPPVKPRGRKTEKGAARALRELGAASMADLLSQHLEEIPPLHAQMGDLASVPDDACGIVSSGRVHALRKEGMAVFPLNAAQKAWRMP